MGRKKGYQPEALVQTARRLFHEHGYQGTSTQMLVDALQVNRNSMYSEFGSKQALFEAVLADYEATVLSHVLSALEREDSSLESIAALFEQFGKDAAGPASGYGCLLCNTAVELAGAAEAGGDLVSRYFARIEAAYRTTLEHARRDKRLARGVKVDDEAQLLTSLSLGVFVLVRGRAPASVVQGAARAVKAHLGRLTVSPARS